MVCAECMKTCCLGVKNSVVKGLINYNFTNDKKQLKPCIKVMDLWAYGSSSRHFPSFIDKYNSVSKHPWGTSLSWLAIHVALKHPVCAKICQRL